MTTAIDNPNQLIAALFAALDEGLSLPRGPLPGKRPRYHLTLPDTEEIDHTRFNRAYFNFSGMDITISMFSGTNSEEREVPPFDITKPPEGQELSMALMVLKRYADKEPTALFTHQDAQRVHDAVSSAFRTLSKPETPKVKNSGASKLEQMTANPDGSVGNERRFLRDFRVENPKLHALYVAYAIEELKLAREHFEAWNDFSRTSAGAIGWAMWKAVQEEIATDAAWFEAASIVFSHFETDQYMAPLTRIGNGVKEEADEKA